MHTISNEEYHRSEGVSRSGLWNFKRSPFHYKCEKDNPTFKMTPSKLLGDMVHTAVLEPDEYLNRYAVAPNVKRNTKAGKEAYAEFLETVGSKTIATDEQHNQAHDMRNSLMQNEYVQPLIDNSLVEKSIYFTHAPTGLQCKVRPDAWRDGIVVDLKTAADASYRAFQSSAYNYGYYLQAAMIREALKSLDIEMQKFVFLCVENTKPYATAVYILDREAIDYGAALYDDLMMSLSEHLTTNSWPAYDVQVLHLPNYANYD